MTPQTPMVEIVSTGTEILQGLYPDRNAADLSQRLDGLGFRVRYHHAARDDAAELERLLLDAARRSDAIVMTGGLGPTEDDVNRDVIARVWEAPTRLDPKAEQMMRARFESRGIPMPPRNIVQAMIPQDAAVFYNYNGTAPGFGLPKSTDSKGNPRACLLALPGPPKEWTLMWERDAGPWIAAQFPARPVRVVHTLHVALMPESTVNQRILDLFGANPRVEITILADRGHIRVRLIAAGDTETETQALADVFAQQVASRLPADAIMSERGPQWSLEQEINRLLADGQRSITVAESCTGGMVAARITDVAGASNYFREGFVVYSNDAKMTALGVNPETLRVHGAVSEVCVRELARGARQRAEADAAVAVSGIAGPGGGTDDKPVGTVWLAIDTKDRGALAIRRQFPGNRDGVREWATRQALDLFRRWAASLPLPNR